MKRGHWLVGWALVFLLPAAPVFGQGVTAFGQEDTADADVAISPQLPATLAAAVRRSLRDDGDPSPDNLLFLMERSLRAPDAKLTESIRSALSDLTSSDRYDKDKGGFVTGKEKTVETNAAFLRLYSAAHRLYGDESFNEVARGIVRVLKETDVGPAAATAKKARRIAALFEAAGSFGQASWGRDARKELIEALSRNVKGNMVFRRNVPGSEAFELTPGDLDAYLSLIQALLAGYEYSGDLRMRLRAEQILTAAQRRFQSDDGRYRTSVDDEPRFHLGLNAHIARAALRLYYMLDKKDYKTLAEGVIAGFPDAYDQDLPNAGACGLAVEYYFVYPIKTIVIGVAADRSAMHAGALALPIINRVILPVDPKRDREELQRLGYPDRGKPTVFLCTDKTCSAPMSKPPQLATTLARMRRE